MREWSRLRWSVFALGALLAMGSVVSCKPEAVKTALVAPVPVAQTAPVAAVVPSGVVDKPVQAASPLPVAQPDGGANSAELIEKLKAATVLVRTPRGLGSGFVVLDQDDAQYLLTNHHVVAGEREVRVTYFPGTQTEWSGPAMIVAESVTRDLALLRSTGPAKHPVPLPGTDDARELLAIITAGFPFGQRLSADERAPAPTLTRASISAIRRGPLGGLQVLQLDNALNPGNSGGPAVNEQGKVVGVAVAALQGSGISFLVPWEHARDLMDGRTSETVVRIPKGCAKSCMAKVELSLIDPFRKTTRVELRMVEADGDFLAENYSSPYKAEGRVLTTVARPASGAVSLATDFPVAAGKRFFLQVGYGTGDAMIYGLPFDAAEALEKDDVNGNEEPILIDGIDRSGGQEIGVDVTLIET